MRQPSSSSPATRSWPSSTTRCCASSTPPRRDAWRRNGFDLDAGIGIAEGYATLGRVGFEGRFDYRATGTVVNLASRLCSQALGGQILLSARAYATVTDLVSVESVGPLELKGFHDPVKAYNVVSLRE